MEMTDQALNSDHMYGVKSSMPKTRSAPMTVITSDGNTPGSKNVVVVPSAVPADDDNNASKRPRLRGDVVDK